MSRNLQLQVLRGTFSQLLTLQSGTDPDTGASVLPLQQGEMFFATDKEALFFGMPGFGSGYIQIGNLSAMNEQLNQLIVLMEANRRLLLAIACGEGARDTDFDLNIISSELALNPPPSL